MTGIIPACMAPSASRRSWVRLPGGARPGPAAATARWYAQQLAGDVILTIWAEASGAVTPSTRASSPVGLKIGAHPSLSSEGIPAFRRGGNPILNPAARSAAA
jgi:hypothetical protein